MNKIKYEKRMKELDQIAEEQQLRQQVRDRERELGLRRTRKKPAWGKAMMAVICRPCTGYTVLFPVPSYKTGQVDPDTCSPAYGTGRRR